MSATMSKADSNLLDSLFTNDPHPPAKLSERDSSQLNIVPKPPKEFNVINHEVSRQPPTDSLRASTDLDKKLRELDGRGMAMAEGGELDEALAIFSEAIALMPERAQSYNNRAQVYRLMENNSLARADLDKAISFYSPEEPDENSNCAVRNAHIQRSMLFALDSDYDRAYEDMKKASLMGSSFAKSQLSRVNPYAAMCNDMLKSFLASNNCEK